MASEIRFYLKEFRDMIDAQADRVLQDAAYARADEYFQEAKERLIERFLDDKVSEEITAGEHASNTSNTLNGKGNLFSFIGFTVGEKPVQNVEKQLRKEIRLFKTVERIKRFSKTINFHFRAQYPSMSDIDEENPMPDWDSRGWPSAITQNIGGFWSYIYWREFDPDVSFSTTGLEADQILRNEYYEPPSSYLKEMIDDFVDEVKATD